MGSQLTERLNWTDWWGIYFDRFFTYFNAIHEATSIIGEVFTPLYKQKMRLSELSNHIRSLRLCSLYSTHFMIPDVKIPKHRSDHWPIHEDYHWGILLFDGKVTFFPSSLCLSSFPRLLALSWSLLCQGNIIWWCLFCRYASLHGHHKKWDVIGSKVKVKWSNFKGGDTGWKRGLEESWGTQSLKRLIFYLGMRVVPWRVK